MNFLHVSDLHIGKKLCGKSLMEDQRAILDQILDAVRDAKTDAILIAGDLYDKANPSSEAIELADTFLTRLSEIEKPCLIISGNHDSAEQVAYCRRILSKAGIYLSSVFSAAPEPQVFYDDFGEVHVYLLPFVRPIQLRRAFPDCASEIKSYQDGLRAVVERMRLDPNARNVLVAHQFVFGAGITLSDSEERMVGGIDAVSHELFRDFDYVALGHLHAPQRVGSERVRYAGSPLKYSQSEERQKKAMLRVHLGAKPDFSVERIDYKPLHELKSIRGTLAELTKSPVPDMDYVFVTLTDEMPPLDPIGSLLLSYPNFLQLRVENSRTGEGSAPILMESMETKSPLEHFVEFYRAQNNDQAPSPAQMDLLERVISEAEEESHATD